MCLTHPSLSANLPPRDAQKLKKFGANFSNIGNMSFSLRVQGFVTMPHCTASCAYNLVQLSPHRCLRALPQLPSSAGRQPRRPACFPFPTISFVFLLLSQPPSMTRRDHPTRTFPLSLPVLFLTPHGKDSISCCEQLCVIHS